MKLIIIIRLFLLLSFNYDHSDLNYIGETGSSIREKLEKQKTDFHFDKEFDNGRVKFLKYIDSNGDKTLIFVMNDEGRCEYFVIMYDYTYLRDIRDKLNREYISTSDSTWNAEKNGEKFEIRMKKRDWFFTVVTRKNN